MRHQPLAAQSRQWRCGYCLQSGPKGTDTPVIVPGDLNDRHSNTLTGQPNAPLSGLRQKGSDVELYSVTTFQECHSSRDVYYTSCPNSRVSPDHLLFNKPLL